MRRLLLLLAGTFGGAAVGLTAAFLFVYLWFDVLHLPSPGDDPKPGLSMLALGGPVLMLGGAVGAVVWLLRRDRAGRGVVPAVLLGLLGVLLLVPIAGLLLG